MIKTVVNAVPSVPISSASPSPSATKDTNEENKSDEKSKTYD